MHRATSKTLIGDSVQLVGCARGLCLVALLLLKSRLLPLSRILAFVIGLVIIPLLDPLH